MSQYLILDKLIFPTSDPDHPAELQAAVARGEDGYQRVRRLERGGDQHQPRQHRCE